jgi:energy-coupling factor transport system substrate-specific component
VSWPIASFLLAALALAGGFVWYERSRPSSRMLAAVATLAALATLGRIAFAPLPDVKPTTTIVVIAGYTFGGAPGFAVGAVAALASNVFYGQGPWTPWQMLGWGLAGIIGATLARLSGRTLGRLPLALACGAAAVAFGLIQDFSTWITYTGDLTSSRFLLIEGSALPFNVTHAIASVLFFLAFGPALIRMLLRFRARLEVRWIPIAGATLVVALLLAGTSAAQPPPARARAIASCSGYLAAAQNADGGFGGAIGDRTSLQLYTSWAVIGLAAAKRDRQAQIRGARYMLGHLRELQGSGDLERTIVALGAAGIAAPRAIVARLERSQRSDGSVADQVNLTAFAILALRADGLASSNGSIRRARAWLERQQNGDGGFNFAGRGGQSGIDDTAGALQGLLAGGAPERGAVGRAAAFIAARQNRDGGFPLAPGGPSNAQSSAWATQALVAAGREIAHVRRDRSRTPLAYLESLRRRDGSLEYSRGTIQTPVWVTAQALGALAERPLPIVAPRRVTLTAHPPARRSAPRRRAAHRHPVTAKRPGSGHGSVSPRGSTVALARLAGLLVALALAPAGL